VKSFVHREAHDDSRLEREFYALLLKLKRCQTLSFVLLSFLWFVSAKTFSPLLKGAIMEGLLHVNTSETLLLLW